MLTILFLGDIVGEPGRNAVIAQLPRLKESLALDFIIVNGENAAGGRGITPKITIDLLRAGVSVITTGDHIWDQKEIFAFIDTEPRLLRPVNYPAGAPGSGSIVLETAKGKEQLDRHVEVRRDLHREFEAGLVIAALEIADRLIVDADRLGQLAPGHAALSPEHGNAIV